MGIDGVTAVGEAASRAGPGDGSAWRLDAGPGAPDRAGPGGVGAGGLDAGGVNLGGAGVVDRSGAGLGGGAG